MKKLLTIAISLLAVSAFAAGVAFKANPFALLSGGGKDSTNKKAKKEHVANATQNEQVQTKKSYQQVGLVYKTISIQKSYNLATGEVTHNFNQMTRSHVDEATKEQDDAFFLRDLTDLLKSRPELTHDGVAENFKRENAAIFELAQQKALSELPKGDKK
ncbi:hypothetical protein C7N43_26475 [Sphingobacteriales bacterium UPWRP_1]|nr:hypothetical protein B6N25_14115 [Sphingobacteriales bacterium TSM_CSS]PSJ73945.1 hypothetical protein C7N43_26475 [Sphingobacteriales bacterium UPWRP_1]